MQTSVNPRGIAPGSGLVRFPDGAKDHFGGTVHDPPAALNGFSTAAPALPCDFGQQLVTSRNSGVPVHERSNEYGRETRCAAQIASSRSSAKETGARSRPARPGPVRGQVDARAAGGGTVITWRPKAAQWGRSAVAADPCFTVLVAGRCPARLTELAPDGCARPHQRAFSCHGRRRRAH
jgi:hypothetical protein